jgi:hypothetical protein
VFPRRNTRRPYFGCPVHEDLPKIERVICQTTSL